MNQAIQRAEAEGRLIVFPNGRYKYIPSQEYITKFQKQPTIGRENVKKLLDVADKIGRIGYAIREAHKRGRVVVACHKGKIQTRERKY